MKCQFCNKNEADKVFYLNYMGGLYQISVCDDCLQRMWQQAVASGQAETFPFARTAFRSSRQGRLRGGGKASG